MKKNKLTFEGIIEILDKSIANNKPFCFVVDGVLAEMIESYLFEEYGIEDECTIEEYDYEDEIYYVSSLSSYSKEPYRLFIETAKCKNGEFKYSDVDNCNYYVFEDVETENIEDKLYGGNIIFCEYINDDEDDFDDEDNHDCENCDNYLDCLTDSYVELLQETSCPDCTKKLLKSYLGEVLDLMNDDEE